MNIDWTGWIGRRFEELDPAKNKEIPRWAIEAYETQEKHKWKSSGPGFLFIHENGKIVVLEKRHLKSDKLTVKFTARGTKEFNLKESPRYNYWFDVITPRNQQEVMANYEWKLNNKGKKLLSEHGIPDTFAAVTKTEKTALPPFILQETIMTSTTCRLFIKLRASLK